MTRDDLALTPETDAQDAERAGIPASAYAVGLVLAWMLLLALVTIAFALGWGLPVLGLALVGSIVVLERRRRQ